MNQEDVNTGYIPLIDNNHSYYLEQWQKHKNPERYSGLNWGALLLTPFWLSYRHLYDWLMLYFLMQLTVAVIVSFIPFILSCLGLEHNPSLVPWFAGVIGFWSANAFFGLKGNALYYKRIQLLSQKHNVSPLFYRSGASLKSGILTGILSLLLFSPIYAMAEQWTFNPSLDPGVYVFSDNSRVPAGQLDVEERPHFIKYEARINLLFIHDQPVGDRDFRLLLERELDDGEKEMIRDRTFNIFSSDTVTLDLLDSEDPLTDTGTYHLAIYLDEEQTATESFTISLR
ncbi:DUF2628 domain-containing protein [Salisediminibacterium beveridgei]|uniref:DUF2628 domain-containing protein n=1 Tax=Salisediminibacterium beveridgei TaxID=632773 RepID=A0A1D7QYV1_9BACI|nr:DUF2628 domain-containing protein [Salisediminibacterium beveridgei]AOM84158.1 hypothetical protein BBEV_2833 [Salisediminibacterium beveridgei]